MAGLGGDRKALLANQKEVAAYLEALPINPVDRKRMTASVLEEQSLPSGAQSFVAVKALVRVSEGATTVALFDDQGNQCSVGFISATGKPGGRLVLLGGPLVDQRTLDAELDKAKRLEAKVELFEKKNGAWGSMAVPALPQTTCTRVLEKAAKSVYVAEKSYFAETDGYSDDLTKLGLDVKSMGVSAVKVTLKGAGPTGTYSAEVSLKDGVVRIDDSSGQPSVVKPCTP